MAELAYPIDPADQDAIVHAICPYLRDLADCDECLEWEPDSKCGRVQRGCYALAHEVMNICQTGHPHRKSAA